MWERGYLPRVRTGEAPWQPAEALVRGLAPGTSLRLLSRDPGDGACTALWQLPPGWSHPKPFTLAAPEAIYVLEGDLRNGAYRYERGHYAWRPAGAAHGPLSTDGGALVLALWDADPAHHAPGSVPAGPGEPLPWVDGNAIDEHPTPVEGPVAGITVRILRTDPDTGGMTMVINIPPGWTEPRSRHHDCVEESFKLSGDIWLEENGRPHVLAAGDYFFRPPRIKHGPMRTERGTSSLIRFSGVVENHYGPL
jgi:quercetin dioxygenase-like cupin family protein